ncbi:MAG: type III secretion system chaperone family protein [Henriciella sp.]|nr:YbjN domain-containing protein [Hyphomonadaceae bacterium]
MLKSFLAATAVAAVFSSIPVMAQSDDTPAPDTRIVSAVTMADMRAIVTGYDHTIIEEMPARNGIVVETPSGFKYLVLLKVCDEAAACQGVLIGSIHDIPEGTTWEILNQADMQMDAFGLYLANNQLIVDRYMILSGGVQVENFKHEIGSLMAGAPPLVRSIGQLAAAAAEG